jgi:hypothetical protein
MAEMVSRQAPPRFAGSAKVTDSSFVLRATRLARNAFHRRKLKVEREAEERVEAVMSSKQHIAALRRVARHVNTVSLAILLIRAITLAPAAAAATAAKPAEENRVVNYHAVDRAAIENLQRWVAAGHEDWCKDARLVAAEELKRIASSFPGDATELDTINLGHASEGGSAKKVAFEWTPIDGRATYRVTLERFGWLLPIAKDADGVVWVPTTIEILIHE